MHWTWLLEPPTTDDGQVSMWDWFVWHYIVLLDPAKKLN